MPSANPWLAGPAPDGVLPRAHLEDRILNLFSSHSLAVIATVNADGSPVATPVRYGHLGFEIFYSSWDASPKSRNLRRDPRVSAGIVASLVGQASSRGAQLFGTARTLARDAPRGGPILGGVPVAVRPPRTRSHTRRPADRPDHRHHAHPDPLHRTLAAPVRFRPPPDLAPGRRLTTPPSHLARQARSS